MCFEKIKVNGGSFHYLTTNLLIFILFLDFPPVKMGETGGEGGYGEVRFDGYRVSVWVNKKSGDDCW